MRLAILLILPILDLVVARHRPAKNFSKRPKSSLPRWFGSRSNTQPRTRGRGLKDEVICDGSDYVIGRHTTIKQFTVHESSDAYRPNTNYIGLVVYGLGTCAQATQQYLRRTCQRLTNGTIFLFDSDARSPGGTKNYVMDIKDRFQTGNEDHDKNDYRTRMHGAAVTKALLINPPRLIPYKMTFGGFSVMTKEQASKSSITEPALAFEYSGGVSYKSCTLNQDAYKLTHNNDADCRFNAYEMAIINEVSQAWMEHGLKSGQANQPEPVKLGTNLNFDCNRLEARLKCNRENLNQILEVWKPSKLQTWRWRYMNHWNQPAATDCAGINSDPIMNEPPV